MHWKIREFDTSMITITDKYNTQHAFLRNAIISIIAKSGIDVEITLSNQFCRTIRVDDANKTVSEVVELMAEP